MAETVITTGDLNLPLAGEKGAKAQAFKFSRPAFAPKGQIVNSNNHGRSEQVSPLSPFSPLGEDMDFDAAALLSRVFDRKREPSLEAGTLGTLARHAVSGQTPHDAHVSLWIDYQERAAIMEFDGGLSRIDANQRAAHIIAFPKPQK